MVNKTLLLIVLISSTYKLVASDSNITEACLNNPMFGHYYRQVRYTNSSHKEDMILASLGNRYAESLLSVLRLKKLNPTDRQTAEKWIKNNCTPYNINITYKGDDLLNKENYLTTEETENLNTCRILQGQEDLIKFDCEIGKIIRKAPIKVRPFSNKLNGIITSYEKKNSIRIFRSPAHRWAKEKKKDLRKKFPGSAVASKLLSALAMGATSRFMMTQQDSSLRAWVIEQPMASVLPEDIFKKSLELQNGDIYKALLSIENVLSEFWLTPNRNNLKQTSALMSISHTCDPQNEDVFGSWYHLFGTMLLGCVEGPVVSTLVGKTESLGGRVLDIAQAKKQGRNLAYHMIIGTDPQEEKINARGGRVGHNICKHVPILNN